MTFSNPLAFLLLLPLGFAAWRLFRRGRRTGVRYSVVSRLPAKTAGWRAAVASLSPYVLLAGLALLVFAAARLRKPTVTVEDIAEESGDSIAIALTADISGSMASLDLAPSSLAPAIRRLEQRSVFGVRPEDEKEYRRLLAEGSRLAIVKRQFDGFIEKRPDDQIGLVTFGSYAEIRSPLTFDHATLGRILAKVDLPTGNDETQTAIGDGLALALTLLEDAKQKSKVIVLLSDGVNNAGVLSPEEATGIAARRGVRVYVIGVGSGEGFDERELRRIASATRAKYYSVRDAGALREALSDIDRLEKSPGREAHTRIRTDWEERFAPFLVAGAGLALAALLMSLASARRFA